MILLCKIHEYSVQYIIETIISENNRIIITIYILKHLFVHWKYEFMDNYYVSIKSILFQEIKKITFPIFIYFLLLYFREKNSFKKFLFFITTIKIHLKNI